MRKKNVRSAFKDSIIDIIKSASTHSDADTKSASQIQSPMPEALENNTLSPPEDINYCRTVAIEMNLNNVNLPEAATIISYVEMWKSDELGNKWSVQQVDYNANGDQITTSAKLSVKNVSLEKAASHLRFFELSTFIETPEHYSIIGHQPEDMGVLHYTNYLETFYGAVFQEHKNYIKFRPHPMAQPMDAHDIPLKNILKSDDLWLKKPQQPPMIEQLDMNISALFKAAATIDAHHDDILNGTIQKRIDTLNSFWLLLENAYKCQAEYVDIFEQLNKGHLMTRAFLYLEQAEDIVKKEFPKLNIPYQENFLKFIQEQMLYQMVTHISANQIIISKGLYQKNVKDSKKEQAKALRKNIHHKLKEAEKMFLNLGASEADVINMKIYALSCPPHPSPLLKAFADEYKKRSEYKAEELIKTFQARSDELIPQMIKDAKQRKPSLKFGG